MRTRSNPWIDIGVDAWFLGFEAASVMGMRTLKIAAGGKAGEAEAARMVQEKMDAGWALQTRALTGGLGLTPARAAARTLAHYKRRVRANSRRLAKG